MRPAHFEEVDDDNYRSDSSRGSSKTSKERRLRLDAASGAEDEDLSTEAGEHVSPLPVRPEPMKRLLSNPLSPTLTKSSWTCFADQSQTLIFFDWDDTLFPTTELCDRLKLNAQAGDMGCLSDERQAELKRWQEALQRYLTVARNLGSVVVVTNSRRPWVETTMTHYAPNLAHLFEGPDAIKVVYAREVLEDMAKKRRIRVDSSNPAKHILLEDEYEEQVSQRQEHLMKAKLEAMRQQAKAFYKSYPGQSWKNIISLGDMWYEHEAVQELGITRRPASRERLRIKSILLPCSASLSEISLRLNFSRIMLPVYVRFDGDVRVDLQNSSNPLRELSEALGLPALEESGFPLHAWGLGDQPVDDEAVLEALGDLAFAVVQD